MYRPPQGRVQEITPADFRIESLRTDGILSPGGFKDGTAGRTSKEMNPQEEVRVGG